jgi:hypothetical protein
MPHGTGQLKTVHRTRHLNVGEYHPDIVATLKDLNCFIGVSSLKDLEARVFSNLNGVQANEGFIVDDKNRWSFLPAF